MNSNNALSRNSKYGLALHTSSPELGLAINNFAGDSRSQTWNLGMDLSAQLHQHLAEFIHPQTWPELAFIAVAQGPGSFTGTRIGVVVARTLAQQLDISLFAISTLAAVAWETARGKRQGAEASCYALQMPAQRGQLFVAIYSINKRIVTLLPDTVMTPESWEETLASRCEVPYQLIQVPSGLGASVCSLLEIAYVDWQEGKRPDWSDALPFYGQHPVKN